MSWFQELGRKAFHLSALAIPVGYYFMAEPLGRLILAILTGLAFVVEVLRLNDPRIRSFFYILFGRLVREHERYNLLGATYLLLSSLICVYAFAKPVAVAALSFLIVGDTLAALVGRAIGRVRIFGKTLEGSLACLASCLVIGWIIPELNWGVTVVGAVMATLIELLPIPLDDNLRIPLASGFAMTLMP
ncbi:MAG: phosphatidate cytidylyltransferase [Candidatus Eisenbacteria bacterium]